jgi:hypothetical protein
MERSTSYHVVETEQSGTMRATLGCKGWVDRWDRQGASGSNIQTQIARWTLYATSGLF